MNIQLTLLTDNDNSFPADSLNIRRGGNRPENAVIVLGNRKVEVSLYDLYCAVSALYKDPS